MTQLKHEHIEPSILEAAAKWQARLSSGAASDRDIEQHMEWLLEDPAHVEAEEFVTSAIQDASVFEIAAREAFAADFDQKNASSKPKSVWTRFFSAWQWPQYGLVGVAVAALLMFTIVPMTVFNDMPVEPKNYVAGGGGVKTLQLADGSTVSLFQGSEISVVMERGARRVDLKKGRAFFDVTTDKNRPFYVNTVSRQVRVVGTRFEVVHGQGFDRVSVNEGLVSVDILAKQQTPEAASTPVLIEPGMVAFYVQDALVPRLSKKEPDEIGSWSEGVLAYRNAPLSNIVTAINDLFPERPIHLADETLADLTFSGTLAVSSSETMAQQLSEFLGLVVYLEDKSIRLARK